MADNHRRLFTTSRRATFVTTGILISTSATTLEKRVSANAVDLVVTPTGGADCPRSQLRYRATIVGARTPGAALEQLASVDLQGNRQNEFPDPRRSTCTPFERPGSAVTRCQYDPSARRVQVNVYY